MGEQFERIQHKIFEAKQTGNKRLLTLWRNKLVKWQQEYGAYRPINYKGYTCEL